MDTRERVARAISDNDDAHMKAAPGEHDAIESLTDAIMRIVDEERADLVKALRECERLVDCGEWGDVPSVVYAALGERR